MNDFDTASGGHKPHLGLLKIVSLLGTSFKNRLPEVVLLVGAVLEGLGLVLGVFGASCEHVGEVLEPSESMGRERF